MELPYSVKAVEECQVRPPPASVPSTSLPLTFFDLLWTSVPQMQRLLFYEFPHPAPHFIQTILPNLKHSLSLTLQHFFPFCGTLICPPQPHKPYILYTDGNSLSLTVAEADGDFNHLTANYPRDVKDLHPLVPRLPPASVSDDDTPRASSSSLMAVQVTVFPNSGICIGVVYCHVAFDGRMLNHFMKSWASVCRSIGDLPCLAIANSNTYTPPFYNRDVIKDKDPNEIILNACLKLWWEDGSQLGCKMTPNHIAYKDKIRMTVVLGSADISRLKHWITVQLMKKTTDPQSLHVSTFVAVCALFWVCTIKSQETEINDSICHFVFPADCSNRPEMSIPATYFGNCLATCCVQIHKDEIMGENGIIEAAKAIGTAVKEVEGTRALRGAENWYWKANEIFKSGHNVFTAAGSPRFKVYDTDFGWKRPKKSEVVHIDATGSISLNESRDEKDGVEIGIALEKEKVDSFNAIFKKLFDATLTPNK